MTDQQFKQLIEVLEGSSWAALWPILLTFFFGLLASVITDYLSREIRKCNERKELPNKIKTIINITEEVKKSMSKEIGVHNAALPFGIDVDNLADDILNDIEIINLEFNKVYDYLVSNNDTLRETLTIKRQINILKKVISEVILDPKKIHGILGDDEKDIFNSLETLQKSLKKTYGILNKK